MTQESHGPVRLTITGINIYPVKGCAGISVPKADLDRCGLGNDRRWLVVDESGRFLTQREHPCMAVISAEPHEDILLLSRPGLPSLAVPISPNGPEMSVTIWRDTCLAVDEGDA